MYEIYAKQSRNWFLLAFGVTGLMYAHMLSLVMVLVFLVGGFLVLVALQRVTWRMVRYTAMAAVSALLMGLGSYLPMVELSRHLSLKLADSATIWPNYLQFNLGDLVTNSLSMYASTSSMQNVNQAFRPGIGVLMLVTGIALAIFWGSCRGQSKLRLVWALLVFF